MWPNAGGKPKGIANGLRKHLTRGRCDSNPSQATASLLAEATTDTHDALLELLLVHKNDPLYLARSTPFDGFCPGQEAGPAGDGPQAQLPRSHVQRGPRKCCNVAESQGSSSTRCVKQITWAIELLSVRNSSKAQCQHAPPPTD